MPASEKLARIAAFSTDHTLVKGDWLVGYAYMNMNMDGLLVDTDEISSTEFFSAYSYMVEPRSMKMDMHMFHVMYALTDQLTVMAMLPFRDLQMEHRTRTGASFTTKSLGFGDLMVITHLVACENDWVRLIPRAGLHVPTGSIDETDLTPMGETRLPYPMQLGSGTWDFMLGGTAIFETDGWNFGLDADGLIRSGTNKHEYRLGDRAVVEGWIQRPILSWLALGAMTRFSYRGNVQGADPGLNPAIVPTADSNLQGGERLDFFGQATILFRTGALRGQRLVVEVGYPAYQRLDGPQLATGLQAEINWAYTF